VRPTDWVHVIDEFVERLSLQATYLDGLDAAIGDGEHGATMLRSFRAVQEALHVTPNDLESEALVLGAIGATLSRCAGGAAGALYSSFFGAMAKTASASSSDEKPGSRFMSMLGEGVGALQRLGKAQPGDKTMLDTLAPALEAARIAEREGRTLREILSIAVLAGENGMAGTREMEAKKGRASYLGARSVGHQDPAATSAFLLLQAMKKSLAGAIGTSV